MKIEQVIATWIKSDTSSTSGASIWVLESRNLAVPVVSTSGFLYLPSQSSSSYQPGAPGAGGGGSGGGRGGTPNWKNGSVARKSATAAGLSQKSPTEV